LVELLHRDVDLSGPQALLLAAGANALDQILSLLDTRQQLPEHTAGRLGHFFAFRRRLNDLGGGLLANLGQLADLGGDHSEAAAMLAGPSRLDRGIESQQLRFAGDLLNDAD